MKNIACNVEVDNKNKNVTIEDEEGRVYFYGYEIFDKVINQIK